MGKRKLTPKAVRCWGCYWGGRMYEAQATKRDAVSQFPDAIVPGRFIPDAPKKSAARRLKGGR